MLSEMESSICEQIDRNRAEITGFLQALIRCPSITPGEGEKAIGDGFHRHQAIVLRLLRDLNYAAESWEIDATTLPDFPGCGVDHGKDLSNMPVVTGTKQGSGGGRSLVLNGHYDVVPVGDESYWAHPPFAAEISDGKMYGRGTCDMKGGIAAMLQALRILHESGVNLKGDITVQVVPEEEATSMGTLAACQHSKPKADGAIIPEPTGMNILVAMRGNASGSIMVYGRAGHADSAVQPHWTEGGAVNAIYKAVKIIQGLEELTQEWSTRPEKQHKYLNPDMVMPTVIHGGDWIIKYPEKVEIQYDACHIPATKDLTAEIIEKVNAIAFTDPWMKAHPPGVTAHTPLYGAEVSEDEPIIQLVREVSQDLGIQPALIGTDSLTDAIHLINYARVPAISIGPAHERAHKVDEYLEIDELILHTKLLALAIVRWCGIASGD